MTSTSPHVFVVVVFVFAEYYSFKKVTGHLGEGGGSAHPLHPLLDPPLFMTFCYAAVDMPSW